MRIGWLLLPLSFLPMALLVASCDKAPPLTNPPPVGFSGRVEHGDRAAVDARAAKYCGQFGKRASAGSEKQSSSSDIVNYTCE